MTERVYLDWNATAPLRREARAAMSEAMDVVGNPSSVHGEGRAARSLIEAAREQVAAAVGAQPRNVIFTSGGSEANALALSPHLHAPGARMGGCDVALISSLEHPSVRAGGDFPAVEQFDADRHGVARLAHLKERLQAVGAGGSKVPLVALMAANNETGVIQPVREAAALVHDAGGLLHVDAVQALGKIALDIEEMGADLMALSAHKVGGPAGVGALVLRNDWLHLRPRSRFGGGQERGRRGGTENVLGIVGFGAAIAAATRDIPAENSRLCRLRDRLQQGLREIWPQTVIFGEGASRVANTVQFAVAGIKAGTALIALDLQGVAVSYGAACSSGTMKPSEVLLRMGYDAELAECALRVSMGFTTTETVIERFLQTWRTVSQSLLKRREIAA